MNDPFAPGMNREHLKALWDAYFEESKVPAMYPSYDRLQALRRLDGRGVTPADVRSVVKYVRALMNKPRSNYSSTALDWRNLMARTDTFEEHLANARKARGGKKERGEHPTSKSDAGLAVQHPTPNEAAPVDEERVRAAKAKAMEEFNQRMGQ